MLHPRALLLRDPTRYAALNRPQARTFLALLTAALVILCTLTARTPPADITQSAPALHGTIVDYVRHGGDYYPVAADALRAADLPLAPFTGFAAPTLAMVQASLPHLAVAMLLYTLVLAVLLAWYERLRPAFARPAGLVAAVLLLVAGLVTVARPALILVPSVWAGLLVAFALALRRPGRWIEAAALGCAAALIDAAALPFLAVMAALAWRDRNRREAAGWAVAALVVGIALLFHARAIAEVARPLDPAAPGWFALAGPALILEAMTRATALAHLPAWIAAPLLGLALLGWSAWRDPLATRVLATLLACVLYLALFGQANASHAAFVVTPTILIGLAFAPDALRALFAVALDKRRITVTRLAR